MGEFLWTRGEVRDADGFDFIDDESNIITGEGQGIDSIGNNVSFIFLVPL